MQREASEKLTVPSKTTQRIKGEQGEPSTTVIRSTASSVSFNSSSEPTPTHLTIIMRASFFILAAIASMVSAATIPVDNIDIAKPGIGDFPRESFRRYTALKS